MHFWCSSGQVHGVYDTPRGIRPNPEKVHALTTMGSPRNLHEVKKVNGMDFSLIWFPDQPNEVSHSSRLFEKPQNFKWNAESEQAFQELKYYLGRLSVLNKPT